MGDTSISWTDKTWNCIRGCSRTIAAGAKQSGCGDGTGGGCYAERTAGRFCGSGGAYEGLVRMTSKGARWTGEVRFVAEHLADPLRWRKPQRVFVNSMSDLFHEKLTNEQIAAVFGVMAACPQHTFQVLTKRAKRMREWFEWMELEENFSPNATMHVEACELDAIGEDEDDSIAERILDAEWPLPNVWLGVSVENQAAADERIPELLRTPAAVRFLSCEPMIGAVDLTDRIGTWSQCPDCGRGVKLDEDGCCRTCGADAYHYGVDWVIAGCESGPGARPCDVAWLRSLRDQCAAAGVPYFLKQATYHSEPEATTGTVCFGSGSREKAGGVIELPYLDGVQHAAFPEVHRG